jgi:hypothetical protein
MVSHCADNQPTATAAALPCQMMKATLQSFSITTAMVSLQAFLLVPRVVYPAAPLEPAQLCGSCQDTQEA